MTFGGSLARPAVAYACSPDPSDHGYGKATWAPTPDLHGGKVTLNVVCLHTDSTALNFITAEMWVSTNNDDTFTWWIEQGMAYGNPQGDLRYWYWADSRPGYGYTEHDRTDMTANLSTDYITNIHRTSVNQQWTIVRNGNNVGTSVSNPGPGKGLQTGTETTRTSTESRVDSTSASMEWEDTNDTWTFAWHQSGFTDPLIHQHQPPYAEWYSTNKDLHYYMHAGSCG
jgi:hypothetical protein